MKNKKVVSIISTIAFLLILAAVLYRIADIVEQKSSRYSKMPLYFNSEQVDVLICGPSHTQDGIYPYYLWEDFGITSYNIASSGERVNVSVYVLEEVLKKVHPKVVVMDTYFARIKDDDEINMNEGLIHESIDFMPLDKTKIELANYAVKGRDLNPLAFLSNYYAYHGRWKELTKADFIEEYTLERGAVSLAGGKALSKHELGEPVYDEKYLGYVGYDYILRMKEMSEQNGAEFVLINVPYNNDSKDANNREYTQISDVINRDGYGIFYPAFEDEVKIDDALDYGDSSHLNILGAKKATDYLGNYLIDNSLATDHRGDDKYSAYFDFDKDFELARFNNAMAAKDAFAMTMYFDGSKDYYAEVCSVGNKINDEQFLKYINLRSVLTTDFHEAEEDTVNFIKGKLMEDDFNSKNLAVIIRSKENDQIVDGRIFELEDGYR